MRLVVAYGCNDAYVEYTGISMISLFENNKEFEFIDIVFVDMNLSDESKSIFVSITNKYNRNIRFVPFAILCKELKIDSIGRHIQTIYAKLFFSRLEDVDKILYIDSDTIIDGSLEELWKMDIEEFYIAGVETISSVKLNTSVGMSMSDCFINDGVVLINLKKWRVDDIEKEFISYIKKYNGNPPVYSEGTINAVCKGNILRINPRYNLLSGIIFYKVKDIIKMTQMDFYTQEIINMAVSKPVIIHYLCGFYNRPWNKRCSHPLKSRYLYYKDISPWKDEKLKSDRLPVRLTIIKILYMILPFRLFQLTRSILGTK